MTFDDLPHSTHAREWGWIRPDGSVFKIIRTSKKQPTHLQMTETHGLPKWSMIFRTGHVRYSIGHDGRSMFHFLPRQETKDHVIRFIKANENTLTGKVYLELDGIERIDGIEEFATTSEVIDFLL